MRFASHCLLGFFCYVLCACTPEPQLTKIEGFAQGTTYHLTFVAPANTDTGAIQTAVTQEFARIDAALSNYRGDSAIEQFNATRSDATIEVDAELVALVETARQVHRASQGCYDLTIKPLFDLWGFKKDVFTPPDDAALQQTLAEVGLDKLETVDGTHLRKKNPNLRIDISSIGQGYSVGRIAEKLESFGIEAYLVEIGGELQVRGKKPQDEAWRIALEKPLPNERTLHKIVAFDDGRVHAMMTSGTYRHYFDRDGKRYSHILDARSGKPIEHTTVSVTVFHPNPTIADAWSTALLCLGSEAGLPIANQNAIAAFFIDLQEKELLEFSSAPLTALKGISFPTQ